MKKDPNDWEKAQEQAQKDWEQMKQAAADFGYNLVRSGGHLDRAFEKIAAMSASTWQKFLALIERVSEQPEGVLQNMEKETFFRKTVSYWTRLTPLRKVKFAAVMALLIVAATAGSLAGVLITAAIAAGQVEDFAAHLAAPEPGWVYVMHKTMPDGSTHVKIGKTTRTPEARERELEAERGGDYRITHKKYVADMDAGERALKAHYEAKLGPPAVGREQWALKPGIDTDPSKVLQGLPASPVAKAGDSTDIEDAAGAGIT